GTRGEVFIWDLDGTSSRKKLKGHFGSITDVRYTENGKYLISAGEDGQIKVWDSSTGMCLKRIISPDGESSPVNKVKFALMSEQSEMVYFGGTNRFLCRAPFNSDGKPEVIYADKSEPIRCAILSPNGDEIIFAAGKYLMALSIASGEVTREYNTGNCLINSLEFSEDGKRLLTWCDNSRVDMRNPENFYLLTSFRSGTGGNKFSNLAFTEDQKYVITGDHASRFNVWDLNNKQRVLDQGAEQGTVMSFDLESGPNYVLSGSLDKTIKLWQIIEDKEEESSKKPKKKKAEKKEKVVVPPVEIVQHKEAVEDVPQPVRVVPKKVEPVKKEATVKTVVAQTDTSVIDTSNTELVAAVEPKPKPKTVLNPVTDILPSRKNNRRVKPIRHEHKLTFNTTQLTFEIWDAQVIDGDIVSIYVGEDKIVDEYSITALKKTVEFDASAYRQTYVYLHAHNLGTLPPNTVTMTVTDGTVTHQVELRSDLTGSSA
ncbi:MAG: WD40 repeat domain-containing protein, partial [Flavobacteriales bacterium]